MIQCDFNKYTSKFITNIEKVNYDKLLRIVSVVSSFDIAVVVSVVAIIEKFGYVWQMILSIFIIVPLFLITYGLVAKYYKKKGMIKSGSIIYDAKGRLHTLQEEYRRDVSIQSLESRGAVEMEPAIQYSKTARYYK